MAKQDQFFWQHHDPSVREVNDEVATLQVDACQCLAYYIAMPWKDNLTPAELKTLERLKAKRAEAAAAYEAERKRMKDRINKGPRRDQKKSLKYREDIARFPG